MDIYSKKICLCGDSAVGKTSLIRRFVTGLYNDKYLSTLGTIVSKKSVELPKKNIKVNLMIWDISGQADFKNIHASGLKNASGGFVVCDVTRIKTVEHVMTWIGRLKKNTNSNVPVVILINKYDLIEKNPDLKRKAEKTLKNIDYPLLYTSAKTGYKVEEAFRTITKVIITKGSKKRIVKESIERENVFHTPAEVLDYATVTFCKAIGDQDMGMHIVRKQINDKGIEFSNISHSEMEIVMDRLVSVAGELKGNSVARKLRKDLFSAMMKYKAS